MDARCSQASWTPLFKACKTANFTVIRRLLQDVPSDALILDESSSTPLHVLCGLSGMNAICEKDRLNVVRCLMRSFAGWNAHRNAMGWLPLHVACFAGQPRVVAALLACHADPNAASSSKQTALHVCSMKGEVACAVALAYAGCSLTAQDDSGRTAFDLAMVCKHAQLADTLAKLSASVLVTTAARPSRDATSRQRRSTSTAAAPPGLKTASPRAAAVPRVVVTDLALPTAFGELVGCDVATSSQPPQLQAGSTRVYPQLPSPLHSPPSGVSLFAKQYRSDAFQPLSAREHVYDLPLPARESVVTWPGVLVRPSSAASRASTVLHRGPQQATQASPHVDGDDAFGVDSAGEPGALTRGRSCSVLQLTLTLPVSPLHSTAANTQAFARTAVTASTPQRPASAVSRASSKSVRPQPRRDAPTPTATGPLRHDNAASPFAPDTPTAFFRPLVSTTKRLTPCAQTPSSVVSFFGGRRTVK